MMAADQLLERWSATLRRRRDRPAIFSTDGSVVRTFAQIAAEAEHIERDLVGALQPGSVVAVQLGNHPAWPAVLLACRGRGVVVLPIERSVSEQERAAALQICQACALLTDAGDDLALTRLAAQAVVEWAAPAPALLKLTSGTTAAPRAIRFRSAQLLADCEQICDTMGITERDVNFGVIPVSHSYGFSNLITPLLVRGVPLVVSRDRMPRAVLDDLARSGATVFPGMPVFYQAFCEMEAVPTLPRLRLCISAGAPLPLSVARKFREQFGHAIHSFYGSSECGGICYDRHAQLRHEGFVGAPMCGVHLDRLDADTPATRVRVHTPAAADGYRIVGRVSDVINVAGKKVNPAEVEAVLRAFAGVREAVVFGRASTLRNEEVAACVVANGGVDEPALLDFCRQRLSGWQVPKRLFFVPELPVNERGKISRRALAETFARQR